MQTRGITPVLGVLLVLLLVILIGAFIAAFVTGLGKVNRVPQVVLDASASLSSMNITLKHIGGDPLVKNNIKIGIATGKPKTFGFVNMSNVTFVPNPNVLKTGDTAMIHFTRASTSVCPEGGASFKGDEIWLSICVGDQFEIYLYDKISNQVIWTKSLILKE